MNQTADAEREKRRKFTEGFNSTMIDIWKEKIVLLGVYDTGCLYNSVAAVGMSMDEKITEVTLSQHFALHGVFQDWGTGKEVYRGNPGRIYDDEERKKVRKRKKWFSPKYYGSVMKLQEFFADSLGAQMAKVLCDGLKASTLRRKVLADDNNNGRLS